VQQVLTGRLPKAAEKDDPDYPDLGSIVKKLRTPLNRDLPQYVSIPSRFESGGPAYLGKAYEPFNLGNPQVPNYRVPNLTLPNAAVPRLTERRALLSAFDGLRRDVDATGAIAALDQYQQEAVNLLLGDSARQAFDFSTLDPRERDAYGPSMVGQSLLLARRLAEAGVSCVSVQAGRFTGEGNGNWDDHAVSWNIFDQMRLRLLIFDRALTALIEDIHQRGLTKRILVAVLGEFGRTPKVSIASNGRPGREHHPGAMSILVSGGSWQMGQVIGSTDAQGARPKDRPLQPTDFLASVYQFLGIDPRHEFPDFSGRPLSILPDGQPIAELGG